jgi:hypothetical protein
MSDSALVVFTSRGFTTILSEGGSQAWVLDPSRARKCAYLVCTQNRHDKEWGSPEDPHGAAFLVGKIDRVVPSVLLLGKRRWLVRISAYARISKPEVWEGLRNPVRYTTLRALGIDPAMLLFKPVSAPLPVAVPAARPSTYAEDVLPLTIPEAKRGLAAGLAVSPDAIDIRVRG